MKHHQPSLNTHRPNLHPVARRVAGSPPQRWDRRNPPCPGQFGGWAGCAAGKMRLWNAGKMVKKIIVQCFPTIFPLILVISQCYDHSTMQIVAKKRSEDHSFIYFPPYNGHTKKDIAQVLDREISSLKSYLLGRDVCVFFLMKEHGIPMFSEWMVNPTKNSWWLAIVKTT